MNLLVHFFSVIFQSGGEKNKHLFIYLFIIIFFLKNASRCVLFCFVSFNVSYNVKRRRSEGCDARIFVRDAKTDLNNHDIGNAKKKKPPRRRSVPVRPSPHNTPRSVGASHGGGFDEMFIVKGMN